MARFNIDKEAVDFLLQSLHPEKMISILLVKAGCAGNMLTVGTVDRSSVDDTFYVYNETELEIAIPNEILNITDDISITMKPGILPEVIVRNNKAKTSCKCGKSFKIS